MLQGCQLDRFLTFFHGVHRGGKISCGDDGLMMGRKHGVPSLIPSADGRTHLPVVGRYEGLSFPRPRRTTE